MGTTVGDVMTTRVIAVTRDADFKQIASVLRQYRVSACPVIDDAGRVVGVVSEADLLYKAADCELPAGLIRLRWKLGEESKITAVTARELMTSPAVTVQADAPVQVAARVMRDRRLKRLPVVGAGGKLLGIVTRTDVLGVYDRPDADILDAVKIIVADEFGTSPDAVEVSVSSGVVTLCGSVPLPEMALELAARIRHIEGVVAVRDRLAVGQPID
ncbi:MAG TPA: CBS domain-containing protein [Streptosporangiaceae bacterium]|nr:CBS domain-containing protein [Streptosporangiaceae bacterium]